MENEKAKQYVLRLLTQRNYSSWQLRSKLLKKGFSDTVADEQLEWLRRVDLIRDDLLLSDAIERDLKKGYGPRAILWRLSAKGFPKKVVSRALEQGAPRAVQIQKIAEWSAKKKGDKRKIASDLIRRGFDPGVVFDALQE